MIAAVLAAVAGAALACAGPTLDDPWRIVLAGGIALIAVIAAGITAFDGAEDFEDQNPKRVRLARDTAMVLAMFSVANAITALMSL